MESLMVKHDGREESFDYELIWEDGFGFLEDQISKLELSTARFCIVTDSTVAGLYLSEVRTVLERTGAEVTDFIFPAGESSKNLQTVQKLYTHLMDAHLDRKDVCVALGGGVVGDLTGYASATYLRGIDFIQVPTTLLAQVDSSIGGKTGVDFARYKNMVGAFHHPRLVYMNLRTLETLSEEQFACGMGEVLKSGLIRNAGFYEWILNHMCEIQNRSYPLLAKMIQTCCDIKRQVVEEDPAEQGIRAILNLGHTVGHAVEKLKDFELPHGQCIALGTIAAAYISYKRGYLSTEEFYEVRDMNLGFHLPILVDGLASADILETTKSDKKMAHGRLKFVLLKAVGHAVIDATVSDEELLEAIDFINGDLMDEE